MEDVVFPRRKEIIEVDLPSSKADIREIFKMVMESERNTNDNGAPTSQPSKIQKVTMLLRDKRNLGEYFEPRMVSLGPIHHGNNKYQQAEKIKLRLAREFVVMSGKTIEDIFMKIEGIIKELRECFEEEVTKKYEDTVLAGILFVDGCAILQFIFSAVHGEFEKLNIKSECVGDWVRDLFLLENQVPYCLLVELMSLTGEKIKLEKSVDVIYQHMVLMDQRHGSSRVSEELKNTKPTHLLDLLRTRLLSMDEQPEQKSARRRPRVMNYLDSLSRRNVQELKAAGIHVKRSAIRSLRGISFNVRLKFFPGYLWLPPLVVDETTGTTLLNLMAYERCPDYENDLGVNSYIWFLGSLIDDTNDVKELRRARVLYNYLDSDKHVVQLFQRMREESFPDFETYRHVKCEIQEYYENTWKKWIAEFLHNYFSSPWTVLACFGVLLSLALSATQTWYTVHSPPGPCDDLCNKFKGNL